MHRRPVWHRDEDDCDGACRAHEFAGVRAQKARTRDDGAGGDDAESELDERRGHVTVAEDRGERWMDDAGQPLFGKFRRRKRRHLHRYDPKRRAADAYRADPFEGREQPIGMRPARECAADESKQQNAECDEEECDCEIDDRALSEVRVAGAVIAEERRILETELHGVTSRHRGERDGEQQEPEFGVPGGPTHDIEWYAVRRPFPALMGIKQRKR